MIPPLQHRRLRGISRWLKEMYPKEYAAPEQAAALEARALEIDEQMIEEFEAREDVVRDRMMKQKTWGTAEGMETFPAERMVIWGDVFAEFLPTPPEATTSDPDQED